MQIHKTVNPFSHWVTPYLRAVNIVTEKYCLFRCHFVIASLFFLMLSIISLGVPLLLRAIIDTLNNIPAPNGTVILFTTAGSYGVLWTFSRLLDSVKGIISATILIRCDAAIHFALFNHIIKLPHQRQILFDPGRVLADINNAESSFSLISHSVFWVLIPIIFEISMVFFVLWRIVDPVFSLFFTLSLLLLFFIAYTVARSSRVIHVRMFEARNGLYSYFSEKLGYLYDIKINNGHVTESNHLNRVLKDNVDIVTSSNVRMGLLSSIQMASIGLVLTIITLYVTYQAYVGRHSIGDFVMIIGYVGQLTAPFTLIVGSLLQLEKSYVALSRGLDYLEIKML